LPDWLSFAPRAERVLHLIMVPLKVCVLPLCLYIHLFHCPCLCLCQAELKRKCNIQHTTHDFNAAERAKEMAGKAETWTGTDQKASANQTKKMLAKRKPGETGKSWHTHLRPHGLCHLLFGAMKNGWEKVSKKELGKIKLRRSR